MPALETMRVLDFTQYEAGPTCGQYLAWLGADVVKVESPRGDPGRGLFGKNTIDSQYFMNHNGNKRSVVLDLKTDAGKQLFRDLLPKFDALVENQGPGVMERLGFDAETVEEIHPGLIYARIKGYGLSGPYAEYKCFDPLAQAAAGLYSVTGTDDTPPIRPGGTFADTGTGIHTAFAICAAFIERQRTGRGQLIEMSMHEVMTMFTRTVATGYWGPEAQPTPRRHGLDIPPNGAYRCKGEGPNDYVVVTVTTPALYRNFCDAIGMPDLADDERFSRGKDRLAHADELRGLLGTWFAERTKEEAMRILGKAGVPIAATFDTTEVFNDPHLIARDFFATYDHPDHGEVTVMKPPFGMPGAVEIERAPLLGEHTRGVLAAELDLDEDALDELAANGVLG